MDCCQSLVPFTWDVPDGVWGSFPSRSVVLQWEEIVVIIFLELIFSQRNKDEGRP